MTYAELITDFPLLAKTDRRERVIELAFALGRQYELLRMMEAERIQVANNWFESGEDISTV